VSAYACIDKPSRRKRPRPPNAETVALVHYNNIGKRMIDLDDPRGATTLIARLTSENKVNDIIHFMKLHVKATQMAILKSVDARRAHYCQRGN